MSKNYQVCNECCWDLNLDINAFIESKCYRKFCDICGYSVNDDLSMIDKLNIDNVISNHKTKQSLPLFGEDMSKEEVIYD